MSLKWLLTFLFFCVLITLQLTDELSKVEEKLKLTESLLESKVLFEFDPHLNLSESSLTYFHFGYIYLLSQFYFVKKCFAESRN